MDRGGAGWGLEGVPGLGGWGREQLVCLGRGLSLQGEEPLLL